MRADLLLDHPRQGLGKGSRSPKEDPYLRHLEVSKNQGPSIDSRIVALSSYKDTKKKDFQFVQTVR